MASEVCLFVIMLLVDPQRIMVFGVSALLVSIQYSKVLRWQSMIRTGIGWINRRKKLF